MMSWTKTKIAAALVAAAMLGTGTVWTINHAGAQAPKAPGEGAAAPADEL